MLYNVVIHVYCAFAVIERTNRVKMASIVPECKIKVKSQCVTAHNNHKLQINALDNSRLLCMSCSLSFDDMEHSVQERTVVYELIATRGQRLTHSV